MKRVLIAIALAAVSGAAAADALRVGYAVYPFEIKYVINDLAAGARDKQGSESFSAGQFQLLYELDRKALDSLYFVLEAGIGLPAGTQTFDSTKAVTGGISTTSKDTLNTGDSVDIQITTVPLLLGAKYVVPMGNNQVTIGLLAGAVLAAGSVKSTEVTWAGAPPNETKDTTTVGYAQVVQAHMAVLADLGFNIGLGNNGYLGLAVPVGLLSKVKNMGYTETTNHVPTATELEEEVDGLVLGGMTFGFNICWVKPF
jgi:hypothetical protein